MTCLSCRSAHPSRHYTSCNMSFQCQHNLMIRWLGLTFSLRLFQVCWMVESWLFLLGTYQQSTEFPTSCGLYTFHLVLRCSSITRNKRFAPNHNPCCWSGGCDKCKIIDVLMSLLQAKRPSNLTLFQIQEQFFTCLNVGFLTQFSEFEGTDNAAMTCRRNVASP